MAWYRCGGGGLPAGLQSDMDTVLNKKFSTSTTYPPTDWPDTVNLMGPLPEKTASSASVCSFSDGADDVPMSSVVAHIAPTLTGTNAVNMVQTRKNLLNDSIRYKSGGNIYFGGATSNAEVSVVLPAGTYTMTLKNAVNQNVNLYLKDLDANAYVSGFPSYNSASTDPKSKTFTLFQETRLCAWAYNANYTGTSDIDFCQIEVGSTASSYEPYEAPVTYTANLGRTVYGGQADIVNGIGTDENGDDFTFDGQEIPSLLGVNNLWHDAGDTECTYRADISLALQALGGGGRGLIMMRPTGPEETKETEETEGLEDELNR